MRLIDADALNIRKYTRWFENAEDARQVERMIREAPTITSPPNDPLTLEQLREMDGQPVWCIIIDGDYKGESFWGLVSIDTAECICNNWAVILFSYYGKTWLAYRHKPEGGRHERHETNPFQH